MKYRWASCLMCALLGLVLLTAGLLVPAYLRAVDAGVVQSAGQSSATLVDDGQMLAGDKRLGAAQMILLAARRENIPGSETFGGCLADLTRQYPQACFWGNDAAMENLFGPHFKPGDQNVAAASFFVRRENRESALARLGRSPNDAVKELLQTRALSQTAIFSPSTSAAGQAFDAAVALAGLLVEGGHVTEGARQDILQAATLANHGEGSRPLEQTLLDLTSLGERFTWDQLTAFVAQIPNAETLGRLAEAARRAGDQLPVLFSVVQLSDEPAAVAGYLGKFPDKGLTELGASLRYGAGGVGELARSQQRFFNSSLERTITLYQPFSAIFYMAAKLTVQQPGLARAIKWLWYLLAGFFLAAALHFARPVNDLEPVPGFHLLRELLFALGFLLVVLILTEPFLSQDTQKEPFTLRLLPPGLGAGIPAGIAGLNQTLMNPTIILTLLVFFVLQALVYISCLVKLGEIRRQNVPARIKLKLLENEDHLFDAGLYLGFVGTIGALIFASLHNAHQVSLMSAYSSTSFGIIFVVIFKIFHLRPARRALLMQAEADNVYAETRLPLAAPTTVLPS